MTWINEPLTEVVPPDNSVPHTVAHYISVDNSIPKGFSSCDKGTETMRDFLRKDDFSTREFFHSILRGYPFFIKSSTGFKEDKWEVYKSCIDKGVFVESEEVKIYGFYIGIKVTPVAYHNPVQYHIQRLKQITVFPDEETD